MDQDPWNLARFTKAQDDLDTFETALAELKRRQKVSDWMWFVFPQLAGLPYKSDTSAKFAIRGTREARAFLSQPTLSARFEKACAILAKGQRKSAEEIFGSTDSKKFRSSLTLFAFVGDPQQLPSTLLKRYFDGAGDILTLRLIIDEIRNAGSESNRVITKGKDVSHDGPLVLESERRNDIWLNLSCGLEKNGDFLIQGHDLGAEDEYEWQTRVRHRNVPQLVSLLRASDDQETDLLKIVERDWVPVKGEGLERVIRLSGIPFEFSNYGTFP